MGQREYFLQGKEQLFKVCQGSFDAAGLRRIGPASVGGLDSAQHHARDLADHL